MMVVSLISWWMFSVTSGAVEAAIFAHGVAHQMKERQPYDIHSYFNILRAVVGFICAAMLYQLGWWVLPIPLAYWLMFHFLRDGMYYETRRYLDDQPFYWFTDISETTTAKINFNADVRSAMFVVGWGIWIAVLIENSYI